MLKHFIKNKCLCSGAIHRTNNKNVNECSQQESGLTLIELLVAMAVLMLGIWGVMKIFPSGFASIEHGKLITIANSLAMYQAEEITKMYYDDVDNLTGYTYFLNTNYNWPVTPDPPDQWANPTDPSMASVWADKLAAGGLEHPQGIVEVKCVDPSIPDDDTDPTNDRGLKKIIVTVKWKEEGKEKTTQLDTLINRFQR